jgi:hypothetical protein
MWGSLSWDILSIASASKSFEVCLFRCGLLFILVDCRVCRRASLYLSHGPVDANGVTFKWESQAMSQEKMRKWNL